MGILLLGGVKGVEGYVGRPPWLVCGEGNFDGGGLRWSSRYSSIVMEVTWNGDVVLHDDIDYHMQASSRSDNAFAVSGDYAILGQASTVTFIMWLNVWQLLNLLPLK
jgi:hypothetical protein